MPTVIDPLHPGKVREMLRELQEVVSSISGREAAMDRTHAANVLAAKRRATARKEAGAEQLAELRQRLADESSGLEAYSVRRYDDRRSWILKATQRSLAGLADRIRDSKDRQVGERQAQTVRTHQEAKELWETARQDHREFTQLVVADGEEIRGIALSALAIVRGFRVWFGLMLRKGKLVRVPVPDQEKDRETLRADSLKHVEAGKLLLAKLGKNPLPMLFRWVPLSAWLLSIGAVFGFIILRSADRQAAFESLEGPITIGLLIPCTLYLLVLLILLPVVRRLSVELQTARLIGAEAVNGSEGKVSDLGNALKKELALQSEGLSETLRGSDEVAQERMLAGRAKIEAQAARLPAKAEALHRRELGWVAEKLEQDAAAADQFSREEEIAREAELAEGIRQADELRSSELQTLVSEWTERVKPLHEALLSLTAIRDERFSDWSDASVDSWQSPTWSERVVPLGTVKVSLKELAGGMPESELFTLDGAAEFEIPWSLGFPDRASISLEGDSTNAAATINEVVLRVLSTHPAGRALFTLIDPVGLGRDFAGLMHLSDYEETLIGGKIWTQATQIEERLGEISEHIEKVIQMYLRKEFETLDEYNEQAGTIAEKNRFVVIAGFPEGFSDVAMKRLLSIATSGARCGVYLLMHRDTGKVVNTALAEALNKACMRVIPEGDGYRIASLPAGADQIILNSPPHGEMEGRLIHRLGKASVDSNRVEVPFSHIAPAESEWWKSTTGEELQIPIGRSGAQKLQMLSLGKGTRQHALIAGKTGSGKSTLFHVMITNLALSCSPDEVEFYLVDFKKGVEFKCYGTKRLPHARVVAIESDREFGLSVLQRVDEELRRRGDLFRKAGAQDLAGYRKASGELLPRTLLLIDEFQELFTEDDSVAQSASLLLDRIVRQGRAFGVHVILGSQTLGGAYTLARATLGQMVVRIALQCNEADAYLIMDDDNPAPRLLTRPGEGIYNDNAGAVAANCPFQAVWLSEEERNERLDQIAAFASQQGCASSSPVVFEGNVPAELSSNLELAELLQHRPESRPEESQAWFGEPNSIKGPTAATFSRRNASHLLVVGQAEEQIRSILEVSLLSLAAGNPSDAAQFIVLDSASTFKRLNSVIPHDLKVAGPAGVATIFDELAVELQKRSAEDFAGPEIFVLVPSLQRHKKLKQEDDFLFSMDDESKGADPARVLGDIASQGGSLGIHLLVGVDTWNNVSRWLPRKVLAEFEMRVLFQMSANDSANLIDSSAASSLGLHRALYYNEAQGTAETFRPYAEPSDEWREMFADHISK